MRMLTRYVLFELIAVFVFAASGFTLLLIMTGLVHEAMEQGLGVGAVLRLVPYILPNALRFAVPATVLFAACMVYGRLSSNNEIVAAKSLGISPLTMLLPSFVLGILLSLFSVWLNDVAVSWGRLGMQRVVLHSVEEIVYGMLRTQRSYSTNQVSIHVRDVKDRKLIQPMLTLHPSNDSPSVTIIAEEAELDSDAERDELIIFLRNGVVEVEGGVNLTFQDTISRTIPLVDASKKGRRVEAKPSEIPLSAIPAEIASDQLKLARLRETMAVEAAYGLLTGDLDGLRDNHWKERHVTLRSHEGRLHRLRTEPHRRWANGFSCFCFVLIGAPLAMRMRNADFLTTFGMCFVPILLTYYPLLAFAVDRSKGGALPPYSVWLANVVLIAAGLLILRKVMRN